METRILDAILNYLNDLGTIQLYDKIRKDVKTDLTDSQFASTVEWLYYKGYILKTGKDQTTLTLHSIFKISGKGMLLLKNGGFAKKLEDERLQKERQEKKEQLEIEHIQSSVYTNNSVLQTNENVRSTNKWIKIWTAVNALAAAAIVITTLLKPDKSQQQELQQMKESMQFQQQSLRNIQTSLEKINSSIEKSKIDSIRVKIEKP